MNCEILAENREISIRNSRPRPREKRTSERIQWGGKGILITPPLNSLARPFFSGLKGFLGKASKTRFSLGGCTRGVKTDYFS